MDFFITTLTTLVDKPVLFYLIAFVGFLFFGEPIVLALSLLVSTTDLFSISKLIILAFLSALVAESFWFYIGQFAIVRKLFLTKKALRIEALITKLNIQKPFVLLFSTRIFTGLTIAAIIYLGARKVTWRYFLFCAVLVNAFWTPVIVLIGYLTGQGYVFALAIFDNIHLAAFMTIVGIIIFYLGLKSVYTFYQRRLGLP